MVSTAVREAKQSAGKLVSYPVVFVSVVSIVRLRSLPLIHPPPLLENFRLRPCPEQITAQKEEYLDPKSTALGYTTHEGGEGTVRGVKGGGGLEGRES